MMRNVSVFDPNTVRVFVSGLPLIWPSVFLTFFTLTVLLLLLVYSASFRLIFFTCLIFKMFRVNWFFYFYFLLSMLILPLYHFHSWCFRESYIKYLHLGVFFINMFIIYCHNSFQGASVMQFLTISMTFM